MLCCLRRAHFLRPRRFRLWVVVPALLIAVAPQRAPAVGPADSTTSAQARREARRAIPVDRVDPSHRQAVSRVLSDPSLFRRLPTEVIECQGPMFTFLTLNPEVLVSVWRELGVSEAQLIRTGPKTFKLSDGNGTTGQMVIVESSCDEAAQNRIVMYATGSYDGKPFQRPVSAECVLLLRSGSVRQADGREFVAARLDSFMRVDRTSIELFAKALHPLVGRTADQNFIETVKFVQNLSYAAERRPQSIERLSARLENVGPARKRGFVDVAYECAERRTLRGERVGMIDGEKTGSVRVAARVAE